MTITKSKLYIGILYQTVSLLLFVGYKYFIVPVYGYYGFKWTPDTIKFLECFIITSVISVVLPSRFKKPSDILIHLQFLFPVLPMLILYGCENQPRTYLYVTISSFLLIFFLADSLKLKAARFGYSLSPKLYQRLLLTIGWIVIGEIILLGGGRYFNLNIWKVYEFRSAAAANLPHTFGYINPMVSKVIFPFSLVIALVTKEKGVALFSILGSAMMFALTSHKGPLFYPLAVIVFYFILKRKHVIQWLLSGYLYIIISSVLLYIFLDHISFGSLILRRIFFVPAKINYWYFDFFSQNQFVWWARSKITFGFIDYPFSLDVPHLIGLHYVNSAACGANTGWIGSGYAAAGYPGMFFCAVMIGVFLSILNAYARIIDQKFIIAITTAPLFPIFMSSDIFTAFFTHGSLLVLFLFLFLPKSIVHQLISVKKDTNICIENN